MGIGATISFFSVGLPDSKVFKEALADAKYHNEKLDWVLERVRPHDWREQGLMRVL